MEQKEIIKELLNLKNKTFNDYINGSVAFKGNNGLYYYLYYGQDNLPMLINSLGDVYKLFSTDGNKDCIIKFELHRPNELTLEDFNVIMDYVLLFDENKLAQELLNKWFDKQNQTLFELNHYYYYILAKQNQGTSKMRVYEDDELNDIISDKPQVGDRVKYNDSAILDYEPCDRLKQLNIIWIIIDIDGDIFKLSNGDTYVEALESELVKPSIFLTTDDTRVE